MEDPNVTTKEDKRQLWGSPLMAESPMVREQFQSKAIRRRSANINLQRSIQLLDDAVGTPPSKQRGLISTGGVGNEQGSLLRHTTYTPRNMSMTQMDVTGAHDTLGAISMMENTMDVTSVTMQLCMTQDMTTTNVALLLNEDPELAASKGLYGDFMQCFQSSPSEHQVFELIHKYEQVCADQVMVLKKLISAMAPGQQQYKTLEMFSLLEQEKHTWQLIHTLYKDRLETELEKEVGAEKMQLDQLDKHRSEKDVIEELYERDSSVRQCQLVIDWLEHCAAEHRCSGRNIQHFMDKAVSWENTLHRLQTKKPALSGYERPLVDQLDPDAPVRQNRQLDDLDREDENRLLQHLFACVRSGELDKAQKICVDSGQAWRAATLEGWRLYHDPNYTSLGPSGEVQPVEGNPYRDVWKAVCWGMANEPKLNQYEKALYAALSGNLKALLPVCHTWSDYLWAYFKVMLDTRVEQELRMSCVVYRSLAELPAEYWEGRYDVEGIFQDIEVAPNEAVKNQSSHWYCQLQKHIILGDVNGLLELMCSWIKDEKKPIPPHLSRFLAHFTLFLRSVGHITKEELSYAVLEKYVELLIADQQKNLIATYVATLPQESQVTWYAKFLEDVQEKDERQHCLALASESGLDIPRITKTVVENIRTRQMTGHVSAVDTQFDKATTQEDRQKIEAMDWLVFDSSQRAEALKQANAVIRSFVALSKQSAAREVMEKLPPDSIALVQRSWKLQTGEDELPAEDDNALREFMCFRAYLDAVDSFNDWFQHFHHGKPPKPEIVPSSNFSETVAFEHRMKQYEAEVGRWKHNLAELTKTTKDRIYNVLLFPEGWLIDLKESGDDEGRSSQLQSLRSLCIPVLCFLLHTVLHNTHLYTQCLQLADIIAAEDRQLYKVFQQEQLQKLLRSLQESSVALLNQNLDPLGYEML